MLVIDRKHWKWTLLPVMAEVVNLMVFKNTMLFILLKSKYICINFSKLKY